MSTLLSRRSVGLIAAGGRTAVPGEIVDVQTIVGGTGDFVGASGSMRASRTFDVATGGQSDYTGQVCLP